MGRKTKVKTVGNNDRIEFEKLLNETMDSIKKEPGFIQQIATQTHVTPTDVNVIYTAVIYYYVEDSPQKKLGE